MDLQKINGYEFEEIMAILFKKMGFEVEETTLAGDGGIDLIIYSSEYIYSGKYIVQCKHWTSSVGQPCIRDLYGVVMSERANKGILITTSSFTTQAIEFAADKNLELIDGIKLNHLLNKYEFYNKSVIINEKKFWEYEDFEKEKYLYFKSNIKAERNEKYNYEVLREFFHSYIINGKYQINKAGLINEYIKLNEEIINKFCKGTGKKKKLEKFSLLYINGFLNILNGELFKGSEIIFKILNQLDKEKFKPLIPVKIKVDLNTSPRMTESQEKLYLYDNKYKVENYIYSPWIIFKNLFCIFNRYNYEVGKDYVFNIMLDNSKNAKEIVDKYINEQARYSRKHVKEIIIRAKKEEDVIRKIKISQYKYNLYNRNLALYINKIHIPVRYTIPDDKSNSILIKFDEEVYINMEDMIENYYKGIDIAKELEKLDILF